MWILLGRVRGSMIDIFCLCPLSRRTQPYPQRQNGLGVKSVCFPIQIRKRPGSVGSGESLKRSAMFDTFAKNMRGGS
jgi:hypothetical protein